MKDTDAEVLTEITKHKDQAAAKMSRKTNVKLAAIQNVDKQQEVVYETETETAADTETDITTETDTKTE